MWSGSSAVPVALVSLLALAGVPSLSSAQSKTASITGRVVGPGPSGPVPGARVHITNLRKVATTDSLGRFEFTKLKPGSYRIEANLIGTAPLTALVTVNEGERKDIEFRTDSVGQLLPTIYVEGEPAPELIRPTSVFERRRGGPGRFITRDEIARRNPQRILDMIRFLPGVRSDCRGISCTVRLNHDASNCPPAVFIDDQRSHMSVLEHTPPSDIEGVEIYRGPSETPPELNNESARCGGAIAIWTRRGVKHAN